MEAVQKGIIVCKFCKVLKLLIVKKANFKNSVKQLSFIYLIN